MDRITALGAVSAHSVNPRKINTSPTPFADRGEAERLHARGISIFDLASGENFGGSPFVKRLPGIPGKVYPESAGLAYAEALIQ